jgi:hypothetical protein
MARLPNNNPRRVRDMLRHGEAPLRHEQMFASESSECLRAARGGRALSSWVPRDGAGHARPYDVAPSSAQPVSMDLEGDPTGSPVSKGG